MSLKIVLVSIALVECIAALFLHQLGLDYVVLLIGAAITYLISELVHVRS